MTGSDDACRRLALLLAGVAAIGSVASIESNTDVGVGRVEIREDGAFRDRMRRDGGGFRALMLVIEWRPPETLRPCHSLHH